MSREVNPVTGTRDLNFDTFNTDVTCEARTGAPVRRRR